MAAMATGKRNGAGQPIRSSVCSPYFVLTLLWGPSHLPLGEKAREEERKRKDSAEQEAEAAKRENKITAGENREMFSG